MPVTTEDRQIEGPYGKIGVRVYTPGGKAGAVLVWSHGGAFFGGDINMPESDWVARQLAERGIAVVAVDYRLAPIPNWAADEAPVKHAERSHYPIASEEATAAFMWATTSNAQAPVWATGGASAGALRLRDNGQQLPHAVVLVYPVVHAELPPMSAELAAKVETNTPRPAASGSGPISTTERSAT